MFLWNGWNAPEITSARSPAECKGDLNGGDGTGGVGARRRRLTAIVPDKPLVLLATTEDVVRELQSSGESPFYFGESGADPVTGIDRQLRDAVGLAAHPVNLLRRLGEWADRAQASVLPGLIVACWHPAVSAEVLRQASRYPVHVIRAQTVGEALAAAGAFVSGMSVAGVV